MLFCSWLEAQTVFAFFTPKLTNVLKYMFMEISCPFILLQRWSAYSMYKGVFQAEKIFKINRNSMNAHEILLLNI